MKLSIDPSPISLAKPQYYDYIIEDLKRLAGIQNDDGSWGEENSTVFQKIYYTTQVIQCLLKVGFPLTAKQSKRV